MIHDYAILPGVFDEANYSSPDACDFSLRWLKNGLLRSGMVRNLHGGEWESAVNGNPSSIHMRGKELLKKLIQQGRLQVHPKERSTSPVSDIEWLEEAEMSHARRDLDAILAPKSFKRQPPQKSNPLIEAVESLDSYSLWCGNRSTESVAREPSTYSACLSKLMKASRSLMLIDPHLDPSESRYSVVLDLLKLCQSCPVKPLIEIHRVVYKGAGENRTFPDWEPIFRSALGPAASFADRLTVFVWDDFHDRALISNLMGISMANGFDVDRGNIGQTTWSRMERASVEHIQREFDRSSSQHTLNKVFDI